MADVDDKFWHTVFLYKKKPQAEMGLWHHKFSTK
jgi:hypothetical protein